MVTASVTVSASAKATQHAKCNKNRKYADRKTHIMRDHMAIWIGVLYHSNTSNWNVTHEHLACVLHFPHSSRPLCRCVCLSPQNHSICLCLCRRPIRVCVYVFWKLTTISIYPRLFFAKMQFFSPSPSLNLSLYNSFDSFVLVVFFFLGSVRFGLVSS